MISRLRNATKEAIADTAAQMTQQLRQHALKNGWDADVVAHMDVRHENGRFSVHVHPDYSERAFVHEFGNERTRPTAVVRKYSNDSKEISKTLLANTQKHYGGK